MQIDSHKRQHLTQCLTKAIAYHNSGNESKAQEWAIELIQDLTNWKVYDPDRLRE